MPVDAPDEFAPSPDWIDMSGVGGQVECYDQDHGQDHSKVADNLNLFCDEIMDADLTKVEVVDMFCDEIIVILGFFFFSKFNQDSNANSHIPVQEFCDVVNNTVE